MDVSIVIVTHNCADSIESCLDSALSQTGIGFEIIVVDNESSDRTLELLGTYSGRIRVLGNRPGVGFGRACNQGAALSQGQYLYFMAPDAYLIGSDALTLLVKAMKNNPNWGMAGNRILSPDGQVESSVATAYPGQRHIRRALAELPGEIAWVSGASLFFRREVFDRVSGFDPDIFLYSEETDLCLRVRKQGFEIGFVESVGLVHIGGTTERNCDPFDTHVRKMRGLHVFWQKHYAPADVRRLLRRDKWRALFRMGVNRIGAFFQPPQSRAWANYRRYRAIWTESSRALVQRRH